MYLYCVLAFTVFLCAVFFCVVSLMHIYFYLFCLYFFIIIYDRYVTSYSIWRLDTIRHSLLYLFVPERGDVHVTLFMVSLNIESSFKLFIIIGPYVHSCSLFLYCLVSSGLVTLATVHGGRKVVLILSVWCGGAGDCRGLLQWVCDTV